MKRIFALTIIVFSMLFFLVSCGESSRNNYVEWEVIDKNTISDGETVYTKYAELPINFDVAGIRYHNSILLDDATCYVYSSSLESGIKYVAQYGAFAAFVSEGADTSPLDAMLSETPGQIKLYNWDDNVASDIDYSFVTQLDSLNNNPLHVNLRSLRDARQHKIFYLGDNKTLSYTHGTIFEYEGGLYYVNFDNLPNNYFDANGVFSFLRGSIDLYPLDDSTTAVFLEELESQEEYFPNSYIYESEVYKDPEKEREDARNTILATLTICGIIAPVITLTFGILNLIIKKKQKNYFAYSFIIPSAVWIICGIILMIISL